MFPENRGSFCALLLFNTKAIYGELNVNNEKTPPLFRPSVRFSERLKGTTGNEFANRNLVFHSEEYMYVFG